MGTSLEAGTSFAHYRIVGPLGAGGMGEVYKALDTTLERAVAIKILPPALIRNEERLRRFVQEAKAASSLNHPHIVTIHEIGEATVASTGDAASEVIHYIAMELVDGVTLKRKIYSEHADLRTILGYLAQAADGLAKAHAAGIVHRDLKPENVMVSNDGFAKVLDFGLAKLTGRTGPNSSGASSTAVWNDSTREGVIMGTVAYMSPEQVQGRAVDHRTDIFSFGAMLYEAATLQRPFAADSDIDVMHRILHDKPAPVDELNPSVPSELRRVIRRCLAKDPDKRYQSMKDLAIELRELVDEYDELSTGPSSHSSVSSTSAAMAVSPPNRRPVLIALTIASLITIGAIGFGLYSLRRNAPPTGSTVSPFSAMEIQRLTGSGTAEDAAISPDGRYVVFVNREPDARYSLFVRQVATGSDVRILEPGPVIRAVKFSPDGSYVYFIQAEPTTSGPNYSWLYRIPSLGGDARKLLWDVDTAPSFSPDGRQLVFGRGLPQENENAVVIANIDGTGERVLSSLTRFRPPVAPQWSPDGATIATVLFKPPLGFEATPALIDVATGKLTELGDSAWWDVSDMAWMPDGSSLLMTCFREGTGRLQIWRQPRSGEAPTRITNDFNEYDELSLTADGKTLAAAHARYTTTLRVGPAADPSGGRIIRDPAGGILTELDAAPSGQIAVQIYRDTASDIGFMENSEAPIRKLTTDQKSYHPSISADGRTIAFVSERSGTPHVYLVDADGSRARQLTNGSGEILPVISPDGSTVVYQAEGSIWLVSTAGGTPRKIQDRPLYRFDISPDSRHLAFQYWLTEAGTTTSRLRAEPLAGGEPLVDVSAPSSPFLRWTPDGNGISYVSVGDGQVKVVVQPLAGGEPVVLTRPGAQHIESYDWASTGDLLTITSDTTSDIVLITDF